MEFKIQSGRPIPPSTVKQITVILRQAHCPQQVFRDNIPDYQDFDGYTIQLAAGNNYQQLIACDALFKQDELNGL